MIIKKSFFSSFFTKYLHIKNFIFNKNYKATILFDLDDVVADLILEVIELHNKEYNDNLTRDDFKIWISSNNEQKSGLEISKYIKQDGFFRNLKIRANTVEVITRLINRGYEIIFVSDSPEGYGYNDYLLDNKNVFNPTDDKRQWIREYLPMISSKKVIFTSEKWQIIGDVLIDDKPETFEIFTKLKRKIILMDQPYNRYIKTKNRALNLLEAEQMIYKMFE